MFLFSQHVIIFRSFVVNFLYVALHSLFFIINFPFDTFIVSAFCVLPCLHSSYLISKLLACCLRRSIHTLLSKYNVLTSVVFLRYFLVFFPACLFSDPILFLWCWRLIELDLSLSVSVCFEQVSGTHYWPPPPSLSLSISVSLPFSLFPQNYIMVGWFTFLALSFTLWETAHQNMLRFMMFVHIIAQLHIIVLDSMNTQCFSEFNCMARLQLLIFTHRLFACLFLFFFLNPSYFSPFLCLSLWQHHWASTRG